MQQPPSINPDLNEFLSRASLRDWEQAAARRYTAISDIRQNLGLFFVLLGLNAIVGFVLIGTKISGDWTGWMIFDLFGFVIVGILGIITFFKPRWYLVLATAIAIFPFALGVITGLMAIAFLIGIPNLRRSEREFDLAIPQYERIKEMFSEIATGKQSEDWPALNEGKGALTLRARFFDNALVFLLAKKPVIMPASDASRLVIETDKKNRKTIKKWSVNGKEKTIRLPLSDKGYELLMNWRQKAL